MLSLYLSSLYLKGIRELNIECVGNKKMILKNIQNHEDGNSEQPTGKDECEKELDVGFSFKKTKFRPETVKFDWHNRWLNGEEYFQILSHAEQYASAFSFSKFPLKTHPPSTYVDPKSINQFKHPL
jgi:hypothetical protein